MFHRTMSLLVALPALLAAGACGSSGAEPASGPQHAASSEVTRTSAAPRSENAEKKRAEPSGPACEPIEVAGFEPVREPIDPKLPPLVDPKHGLASFYETLARHVRGKLGRPVRIAIYGDSNMTLDMMSGTMRRSLQQRWGDAGHGYVAVGKPWRWYDHMDVKHRIVGKWASFTPSSHKVRGAGYGHGGIAAETRQKGARAFVSTADDDAPVGTSVTALGVFYLKRERGGSFDVVVDGEVAATVSTEAKDPEEPVGYHLQRVPEGPHRFTLINKGVRRVRLLGTVLERGDSGVVLDSLGIGGITYYELARMNERITESMLKQRRYDLVMFLLGTNMFKVSENADAIGRIVAVQRRARPGLPILIMSPPDLVKSHWDTVSTPQVKRVAVQLGEIASSNDCAFWDFREAMGGEASMGRFYRHGLAGKDLYHFTRKGAAFMGSRILAALGEGLRAHLAEHPDAGCSE